MDIDLRNYFGTIDHEVLVDMLRQRIKVCRSDWGSQAQRTDGTLWTFGQGKDGALGLGTWDYGQS
ncbi:MAG: hypothetical protein NTZ90_17080 [Proteobacteria bacterium]|nr:hypothetical protein [Pseudomonadota bacterium]